MPSPEKFRETLTTYAVDADIVDEMYHGYDNLESKTNKKIKSAFFKQALDVMNAKLSPESVQEILEANACCKSGARQKASKEFARIYAGLNIPERLQLISQKPYLNMGTAELDEAGYLIVHGVSHHPEDRYECACPTISKVKRDYLIPREYCFCCGGHFKYHYEIMLGVKLVLGEIVSSPHDTEGQKPCVFKYRILE